MCSDMLVGGKQPIPGQLIPVDVIVKPKLDKFNSIISIGSLSSPISSEPTHRLIYRLDGFVDF